MGKIPSCVVLHMPEYQRGRWASPETMPFSQEARQTLLNGYGILTEENLPRLLMPVFRNHVVHGVLCALYVISSSVTSYKNTKVDALTIDQFLAFI